MIGLANNSEPLLVMELLVNIGDCAPTTSRRAAWKSVCALIIEPNLFAPLALCVVPIHKSCQSSSKPDMQIATLCSLIRCISLSTSAMVCFTLFRNSRCACVKFEDIFGSLPSNRYRSAYYLMKARPARTERKNKTPKRAQFSSPGGTLGSPSDTLVAYRDRTSFSSAYSQLICRLRAGVQVAVVNKKTYTCKRRGHNF
jgi:hypothetical protein